MKVLQHSEDNQINKNEYLSVTALISIIFLIICLIKGFFPFGTAHIDTSDFQDQSVPLFYYLWNVMHGKGNLSFCWEVGGGLAFPAVVSFLTLISPFNILFLFIKRSWIEPFMTFYVLIKFIAMGLSMCFFLRNFRKEAKIKPASLWIIMGSVGYALSAYSVQYYLFSWLDNAALFPLLIYALLKMLKHESDWHIGKYSISYLLLMTLIFIMMIPQAYMTCFYLILVAGSYFLCFRLQSNLKKIINRRSLLKFGLTTLLALTLSAAIFLPSAILILHSGRISGTGFSGISGYLNLLREPGMDPSVKRLMLYSVLIPLVYWLFTCKKAEKNSRLFEGIILICMILPVFVESINIIWHMGPYICFPMRFGYMMVFTVIAAAGNRMAEGQSASKAGTLSKCMKNKKWEFTLAAIWIITILGLGIWLMKNTRSGEAGAFIQNSEEVKSILPDNSDIFHKTKLADSSISHNYPLITQTAAFSNNVHLIPPAADDFHRMLGYSYESTFISDVGGTLFSDALLGYTTTFKSTIPDTQ